MSLLAAIGMEMWRILLESSVYILLGIGAAGLINSFINKEFILAHLQDGKYKSVIKAALFGIPLPL